MTDTLAPQTRAETAAPIRVLIIDAHPAVGLGLTRLVSIMPGVEVCGLATCGEDGLTCADLAPPDVALVDVELPQAAGLATIRRLRHALPTTRIVALGLYSARRAAALAAGAHAFLLKDAGFDALRAAIVVGSVNCREDQASVQTPRSA